MNVLDLKLEMVENIDKEIRDATLMLKDPETDEFGRSFATELLKSMSRLRERTLDEIEKLIHPAKDNQQI